MASRWEPFAEIAWRPNNDDPAADAGWLTPAVDIVEEEESFVVLDVDGSEAVVVMAEGVLTLRVPKREPASASPSSLDPLRRAS